jgi:hypothetical protein
MKISGYGRHTPPPKKDSNESYTTTGVPKMFPTVAALLAKCIAA